MNSILQSYLLDYQKDWIVDTSKRKIWVKARQIGATDVGQALDALLEATEFPHNQFLCSYRLDGAKEMLRDVKKWIDVFSAIGVEIPHHYTATEISFGNGSRIKALPATPEALRGPRGTVRIDEAAFVRNLDQLWTSINPIISSNKRYRMVLTSTPFGKQGPFYEFSNSNNWSCHTTTIYRAVQDGLIRDIDDLRDTSYNFAQEFECSFDSGGFYFFHDQLINLDIDTTLNAIHEPYLTMGVDLGKINDYTSFVLIDHSGLSPVVVATYSMRSISYVEQKDILIDFIKKHNIQSVIVDSTSHESFKDELQAALGSDLVKGRHFTNKWKNEAFPKLKKAVEKKSVQINYDECYELDSSNNFVKKFDKPLLHQLLQIKQTTTATGLPAFEIPRTKKGHGDGASALVIAYDGMVDPRQFLPHEKWLSDRRVSNRLSHVSQRRTNATSAW